MTRKQPDTLDVEVPGGRGTIKMRQFTSREYIAMKRGEYDDIAIMEMTAAAVTDYLPGKDPLDLPPETLLELAAAWIAARTELALPPPKA